jgi:quercetin dioxygenase-like cupin family protein
VFDLSAEVNSLHHEAAWQRGDRNARTLVEEPGFRLVLTAAKAGTRIREHRTPARVGIETITGHLRIHLSLQVVELPKGHILVLDREVPHEVEALEESAFLLTLASAHQADTTAA